MSALSFQSVSKSYPAKQAGATAFKALDQVSFEVQEGEFFGLLGPNGAGKTTLISTLAGLSRPTQGRVLVHGHDVQTDYAAARRLLGVVPQELVFDPFFTVREALRIQSGYFGIRRNDDWIDELLSGLGLADKATANMRQLSGGMKRRVLIAQALVHKPSVIVLDEPTAGVDVELRQTLWQFVSGLNKRLGSTVLLTTHYLEEAEALCGRIAMLQLGRVVALEKTSDLLRQASSNVLRFKTDQTLPAELAAQARVTGRVVQLSSRAVVVRDSVGTESLIPNSSVIKGVLQNHTLSNDDFRVSFLLKIADVADYPRARELILQSLKNAPRVLPDPAGDVLIASVAAGEVTLETSFWINDLQPKMIMHPVNAKLDGLKRAAENALLATATADELRWRPDRKTVRATVPAGDAAAPSSGTLVCAPRFMPDHPMTSCRPEEIPHRRHLVRRHQCGGVPHAGKADTAGLGSALRHGLGRLPAEQIGVLAAQQQRRCGDGVVQARRRAQAFGEGRGEQHHRPAAGTGTQGLGQGVGLAEQRIELGPARFHDGEMPGFGGQRLEGPGGRRPLGAIEVELPAHAEMPAGVAAFFDVEAVEELHLGAREESGHVVGGAEDRPRRPPTGAARHADAAADDRRPGALAAGRLAAAAPAAGVRRPALGR